MITVVKGLSSHECAYAFWTGWHATVKTTEGDFNIFIKSMTLIDKDHVWLSGQTDCLIPYHAVLVINPHRPAIGTLTLEK